MVRRPRASPIRPHNLPPTDTSPAALATFTHAAYGPGGHGGGPPSGFPGYGSGENDGDDDASTFFGGGRNGGGDGNNPFGDGSGNPNGGAGFVSFDISAATRYRWIHGILCSLAMVLLFPIGSILMRVVPGRFAIWIHAAFQVVAMLVHIAGVGLGIYLVTLVQLPFSDGGNLLTNDATKYHPIIGLVTLALLLPQPIVGWLHHAKFMRVRRRQIWSYIHLFNGRVGITIGIINGGLGLNLAAATASRKRTYIIVAAVMWALWMLVALWAEVKKARASRKIKDGVVAPPAVDGGKPVVMAGARDVPPPKRRSDSRSGRASRSRSISADSRDAARRV